MLAGVVLYGALVIVRGTRAIGAELEGFAWWTFAGACGLSMTNYLVRFLRWEYYLTTLGVHEPTRAISVSRSLLVFLSGFVLTVTPGKVGEVFKSLVLFELEGVDMVRTAPIVIAERLTDVIGVVVLIVVGSSALPGGLFWAGAGAVVVVMILVLVAVPGLLSALIKPLGRLPGAAGRVFVRALPKIERGMIELRHLTAPRHLVVPSLLAVVGWSLEGVGVWLILRGFGQSLPALHATFSYATATLAGALVFFVPGGLGVTEKVLEESMVVVDGVPGAVATATMLLARLATLWFAVAVGFVALGVLRARNPTLLRGEEAKETA